MKNKSPEDIIKLFEKHKSVKKISYHLFKNKIKQMIGHINDGLIRLKCIEHKIV